MHSPHKGTITVHASIIHVKITPQRYHVIPDRLAPQRYHVYVIPDKSTPNVIMPVSFLTSQSHQCKLFISFLTQVSPTTFVAYVILVILDKSAPQRYHTCVILPRLCHF